MAKQKFFNPFDEQLAQGASPLDLKVGLTNEYENRRMVERQFASPLASMQSLGNPILEHDAAPLLEYRNVMQAVNPDYTFSNRAPVTRSPMGVAQKIVRPKKPGVK